MRIPAKKNREFHYTCSISPNLDYSLPRFEQLVDAILQDGKGWRRWGFRFVPHAQGERTELRKKHRGQFLNIQLEENAVIRQWGDDFDGMSVANCSTNEVSINYDRWIGGAKPNPGDPVSGMRRKHYRIYVILHEVGHILSRCHQDDHKSCTSGPAPVMLQQTNGVGNCTPNAYPLQGIDNVLAEKARPQ